MPRLYLVRHGRAAAGFTEDLDPGLSAEGAAEAEAAAARLAPLGPLPVRTSPLRRTRETAAAFERAWGVSAETDHRVAEVGTPGMDLTQRGEWLRAALAGDWSALDAAHGTWRRTVVEALLAQPVDTVVVTHFVAINVAVGAATGDDRVVVADVGTGSVTVLDHDGERLTLVELGGGARGVVR